ncbi:cobalt-precorrin-6A reductase [Paraburkholderia solisilvae]|uniref:Precorrin-6A reductase n=1 Tax=Paraburkholderia solisilvae TaxID=624376 RepID=A0A6J5DBT2_9BURK|nr:cobalt-precorrin-6A reductase [Paraburkholderia solisilvae]CAB3751730.1 Precorrin-6A reductase [Paraburkholderia solisilvae]
MSRILLLGGTGDALQIARKLTALDVYSVAGLGRTPVGLACAVRVGGFGGEEGLAQYLHTEGVALLIDATHPYAARISANAAAASRAAGVPCWALRRPGWDAQPDDDWRWVDDWAGVRAAIAPFARPFFTLGREALEHLDEIPAHQHWTVRCLDAHPGNARATVIDARGPFSVDSERALFAENAFDVVISKHSGGSATQAKLEVARERGVPVIMVRRPVLPAVERMFAGADELLAALQSDAPRA